MQSFEQKYIYGCSKIKSQKRAYTVEGGSSRTTETSFPQKACSSRGLVGSNEQMSKAPSARWGDRPRSGLTEAGPRVFAYGEAAPPIGRRGQLSHRVLTMRAAEPRGDLGSAPAQCLVPAVPQDGRLSASESAEWAEELGLGVEGEADGVPVSGFRFNNSSGGRQQLLRSRSAGGARA